MPVNLSVSVGLQHALGDVSELVLHGPVGLSTPALGALTEMVTAAGGRQIASAWRRQAVALLRSLAPDPQWATWRDSLIAALDSP